MNENETKQINYKELADYLLDYICDANGVEDVIRLLVEADYDVDQLEDLGFNREDIELIINEMLTIPKDYDILYIG